MKEKERRRLDIEEIIQQMAQSRGWKADEIQKFRPEIEEMLEEQFALAS